MKLTRPLAAAAALALAALGASCVSGQQYKTALDEKEAENKTLREERTQLKGDVRDLNYQRESLETALAEANARLLAEPVKPQDKAFPELDAVGVKYGTRDGNMVLSIPTEITFDSGKAQLSKKGKAALAAVAKTLQREYAESEYWIEGHTDSDPIQKSKFASNRDLSVARAMAVLRHLVEEEGVADGQFVVAGWGEYRPVAANDSKANKGKNRRVEIVVHR